MQDFHKKQLENHREIFKNVEPIVTQDGKQDYQKVEKFKKNNKIRNFFTKLFGISNKKYEDKKTNKKEDIMEAKIKQMNSEEILKFLNKDEIYMKSAEIMQFLNTDNLSKVSTTRIDSTPPASKVSQINRKNSSRNVGI